MTEVKKLKLVFGNPENGWLPTELKFGDFELNFSASNIPENPINKLCSSLILALNGIESEIIWNLEPQYYIFEFRPRTRDISILISKSEDITEYRNPVYELAGDYESIILPIYRGIKKFNALESDKVDWAKVDQIRLKKLTKLIKERKTT
ncbi:hypothetical protein [Flagellimonas olearia]|uniref:Uncharacterized protein n=1 Tax=Flagellimonas olearia TaxID=552546 RepID=A0A444VL58_9FLAO|nr:hypothetical protein [Allomuricauda olearia]RYC51508.1 hypothetical protein DN53_11770 [Allomuricauda olearia]